MMKRSLFWFAAVGLCVWMVGCYNDPLDPTQLGRFEPTPTVNVILETLGVATAGVALILGIDRVLDMARTVTNVTGDAVVAVMIAAFEKQKP